LPNGSVIGLFEGMDALDSVHAERAMKAALLGVVGMHRFRSWVSGATGRGELAALAATAGVHTGRVSVCHRDDGAPGEAAALDIRGEPLELAARLQAAAGDLGWSVAASNYMLEIAGARFGAGRKAGIAIRSGVSALEVVEVTRLLPRTSGDADADVIYAAVAEAIAANTRLIAAGSMTTSAGAALPPAALATDRRARCVIR
jgi:hypothetical protein